VKNDAVDDGYSSTERGLLSKEITIKQEPADANFEDPVDQMMAESEYVMDSGASDLEANALQSPDETESAGEALIKFVSLNII